MWGVPILGGALRQVGLTFSLKKPANKGVD